MLRNICVLIHRRITKLIAGFILAPGLAGFLFFGSIFDFLKKPTANFQFAGQIRLESTDRLLILAPHPDDEVLCCGGILQEAKSRQIPVKVVFLTYGDNNQWSFLVYRKRPVLTPTAVRKMGEVRRSEAISAGQVLGLSDEQLVFLGYPDFGTLTIWNSRWGEEIQPAKGLLTKASSVPYVNAFRPGAPYRGEEIIKDLKNVISDFKPTKIFVSHPADHNTDHRAFYLFARVALWDLASTISPHIYPYLIHYKKWPLPRGNNPEREILPPSIYQDEIVWRNYKLTSGLVNEKLNAIKKHKSQYRSTARYLLSFIRSNEIFGDFPEIRLDADSKTAYLSSPLKEPDTVMPEELNAKERALFVGVEERRVAIEDGSLILTIQLSRPVGKTVGISISAFGYRADTPFEKMPKIRVHLGATNGYRVLDQKKVLSDDVVKIERRVKEITVKIPLALMGHPQKVLTSAQTYFGNLALDWTSWRVINIFESAKSEDSAKK